MKSYSESHLSHGNTYDQRFNALPVSHQFAREKVVIAKVVRDFQPRKILDLACGTGRICKVIEDLNYPAEDLVGLDISKSMLSEAKKNLTRTRLICCDLDEAEIDYEGFEMITAFRFFCNAEPELRIKALNFVYKSLSSNGVFLFNMHNNQRSISNRLLSIKKGEKIGVDEHEFVNQIEKSGFAIVKRWSLGIWVQDHRKYYFSNLIGASVENLNFRLFCKKHHFGLNNLYLCKKIAR